jgi:hypothetical protein
LAKEIHRHKHVNSWLLHCIQALKCLHSGSKLIESWRQHHFSGLKLAAKEQTALSRLSPAAATTD